MEKKDRPYTVVPYDPKWPKNYEHEKNIISKIFGKQAQDIQHIGSTSVKGMWAKPQIDILVIVDNLDTVDNVMIQMQSAGYAYQPDFFTKHNEKYFVRDAPSGQRLVSVHVMQKNDPKALSHICFRNYLREHPTERELYSQIKKRAYESGLNRVEYPKMKRVVLTTMLERANNWYHVNNQKPNKRG